MIARQVRDSLAQYGNQASARRKATEFRVTTGNPGRSRHASSSIWTFLLLLGFTLASGIGSAFAETLSEKEVAVRAAFLFRLAFFVNWPESAFGSASAPLVFCLTDGTTPQLRTLLATQTVQRSVRGRKIEVRQLVAAATTTECHLVYSDAGTESPLGPLSANTLAIVDTLDGLAKAGAVALVREEHDGNTKLQFYVYRERLRELSVSLNAQLMQLARFYEPAA